MRPTATDLIDALYADNYALRGELKTLQAELDEVQQHANQAAHERDQERKRREDAERLLAEANALLHQERDVMRAERAEWVRQRVEADLKQAERPRVYDVRTEAQRAHDAATCQRSDCPVHTKEATPAED